MTGKPQMIENVQWAKSDSRLLQRGELSWTKEQWLLNNLKTSR